MPDLSTSAGVLRFCEEQRQEMERVFQRCGRFESRGLSYMGFVFATQLASGKPLDRVRAEPCRVPTDMIALIGEPLRKDLFAKALRQFAKATKALGTVTLHEMWMVSIPKGERDQYPADLADAPDDVRREALTLQLEHSATGRRYWMAEIQRNPTRLLPWRDSTPPNAQGRLVNLSDWQS